MSLLFNRESRNWYFYSSHEKYRYLRDKTKREFNCKNFYVLIFVENACKFQFLNQIILVNSSFSSKFFVFWNYVISECLRTHIKQELKWSENSQKIIFSCQQFQFLILNIVDRDSCLSILHFPMVHHLSDLFPQQNWPIFLLLFSDVNTDRIYYIFILSGINVN